MRPEPFRSSPLVILFFFTLALGLFVSNFSGMIQTPAGQEGRPEKIPPAAPGQLIDIGGYRLHLISNGKGRPAVVLIAGAGDFSFDWSLVQPQVAKFTRVCAYDRAGEAWSDPGPMPRTMRQEAYELHLLLDKAGIEGPYVLVGHSLGGLIARVFAGRYPKEVAGMVLVSATDPDTTLDYRGKLVRMRELAQGRPVPSEQTMMTSPPHPASAAEIQRFEEFQKSFGAPKIRPPFDRLPVPVQVLDLWARSRPPRAAMGEDFWPEELQQLYEDARQHAHPRGDIPLIVLAPAKEEALPPDKTPEEWRRLGEEKRQQRIAQAALSKNGMVIFDKMSGHHIQLDNPELVIQAIRKVVEAARTHSRLDISGLRE